MTSNFQKRHWVLADLIGKKAVTCERSLCRRLGEISRRCVDRCGEATRWDDSSAPSARLGRVQGHGFTAKVIWSAVREAAITCGIGVIAPHDLRRTCARLCHQAGGELEQIQFLLGHVSIQTTERYHFRFAVLCRGDPSSDRQMASPLTEAMTFRSYRFWQPKIATQRKQRNQTKTFGNGRTRETVSMSLNFSIVSFSPSFMRDMVRLGQAKGRISK